MKATRAPEESTLRLASFAPIYDKESRILILGTMPSPASLRAGMYYSHPQNSFWRILGDLTHDAPGASPGEKAAFLLRNRIALWDTLQSCVRPGALDSDITACEPNEVAALVRNCPELAAVFLNGSAAYRYYLKYHKEKIGLPFYRFPSTSPANCREGYAKKREEWSALLAFL